MRLVTADCDLSPMPSPSFLLSKSSFVKGCQCEKALYLHRYHPELRAEITDRQQAVFDRGTDVGVLARQLFPGGTDASPSERYGYSESVTRTKQLIDQGCGIIYEAAFQHDGVYAAVDILVKRDEGWKAYEVKSTLGVKEVHVTDAALQYHVIAQSGMALEDIALVHLNRDYVRKGPLEINKLFVAESIREEVLDQQEYITKQITLLKEVLAQQNVPAKEIGPHCNTPYACDFVSHCWQHIPSPSIFDITGLREKRSFELYNGGVIRFEDITPETPLNDYQRIQVDCHLGNKEHVDREKLQEFLAGLTYPMYFMDFETFNPAVPVYDGTRPYQQIPFQFSLHYKNSPGGELRHVDFLAEPGADPRREFLEKLLHYTRLPGTILTYNVSFERGVLLELAPQLPEHALALEDRISRLRDLMIPFRNRWYYSPKMNGSYSIKEVLPALVPDLSYDGLAISDGTMASDAFEHMNTHPELDHTKLREQMLEYCKMDTMGMVRVVERVMKL